MTAMSDFARARWRKSSRSATSGQCVELAHTEASFAVRDSKNAEGPLLALNARNWLAFIDTVKSGQL